MLFLFKLWIFDINLTALLSFIVGIGIGMLILCLIYALLVVLSLHDKKYDAKVEANDLSAKEAEEMIHIAQSAFKSKDLRGDMSKTSHFIQVGKDLVYGIASRFYPNSKYPLAELTIDECLELISYVQIRLSEFLDKKVLRLAKKLKVSKILELTRATTAVVDSRTFEVAKEITKGVNIGRKILNVINPVWWTKKIIGDVAIGIVMDKIYLAALGIIGEEAFKIYSKSYKDYAEDIDSGVDALADEIGKDIKLELKKEKPELFGDEKNEINKDSSEFHMKDHVMKAESGSFRFDPVYDDERPLKTKKEVTALPQPEEQMKLNAPEV